MARTIKQVYFESPFPLFGPRADTAERWTKTRNKEGKKQTAGKMVDVADAVSEDSIGIVFVVYDRNGNRYTRRAPWAKISMVEYDEEG